MTIVLQRSQSTKTEEAEFRGGKKIKNKKNSNKWSKAQDLRATKGSGESIGAALLQALHLRVVKLDD
ncbi:unnamed protein product [Linum trigynum]|uniref:Uncharacterized protein n=1 Tax=Linum trigynum TaxID=586398 RepID=A0AAV2EU09_9ROSI